MNKISKTFRIEISLDKEIKKYMEQVKPVENYTQFLERACWERIKRIKKGSENIM